MLNLLGSCLSVKSICVYYKPLNKKYQWVTNDSSTTFCPLLWSLPIFLQKTLFVIVIVSLLFISKWVFGNFFFYVECPFSVVSSKCCPRETKQTKWNTWFTQISSLMFCFGVWLSNRRLIADKLRTSVSRMQLLSWRYIKEYQSRITFRLHFFRYWSWLMNGRKTLYFFILI